MSLNRIKPTNLSIHFRTSLTSNFRSHNNSVQIMITFLNLILVMYIPNLGAV
jgi:hypothetical protein